MINKIISLLIAILFLPTISISQDREKANKYFNKAKISLRQRDEVSAINNLEKSIFIDPTMTSPYLVLGDIYFNRKNYKKSIYYYSFSDSLDPKFYLKYKLGNSNFLEGNYAEAKEYFNSYLSSNPKSKKSIIIAKKRIDNCNFAFEAIKNPVEFNPINVGEGINTYGFEYNPVVSVDGKFMIYTGIRIKNGRRVEDFFISKNIEGKWGRGIPLPGEVNTNENEGAHCMSMNGSLIYFTSCGRKDGFGSCDIYVSVKRNGLWTQAINMGRAINSSSWDAHPSISPDSRLLIFSSTRPNGKGGKDLWQSEFIENKWTKPRNVSELNTSGNEVTPFLHADGKTLYFSSDGLMGMGGTDFFVSYYNDKNKIWSTPVNLGYKINSSNEEYSLMVKRDGKTAFYATDALDGFGEMDIFSFELNTNTRGINTAYLKGSVIDEVSNKNIDNSRISIVDLQSSNQIFSVFVEDGEYQALLPTGKRYAAIAMAKNYTLHSETFTFEKDSIRNFVNKNFYLKKLKKGRRINLNNINFNTGKFKILPESYFELDILAKYLKEYSSYNIKIIGHTDNVGKESDNLKLSKSRAYSVKKYLGKSGISLKRMKSYGLGETKPVSENETEEGRSKNRRTEILLY